MTYRIAHNAGPPYTQHQYARLSEEARKAVSRAHDLIWQFVTQGSPPFNLTGSLVGNGVVFDDPSPKMDYDGSVDGAWIWSCPIAHFRFRIIISKSKLDTWEYGAGPCPKDLALVPPKPIGKLLPKRERL
jgi:hypothetical protein